MAQKRRKESRFCTTHILIHRCHCLLELTGIQSMAELNREREDFWLVQNTVARIVHL